VLPEEQQLSNTDEAAAIYTTFWLKALVSQPDAERPL
jgi:hypothetical protein